MFLSLFEKLRHVIKNSLKTCNLVELLSVMPSLKTCNLVELLSVMPYDIGEEALFADMEGSSQKLMFGEYKT